MPRRHEASTIAVSRAARALLGLSLALACSDAHEPPDAGAPVAADPVNLVLITIDTLRADRLSPYGYATHTPAVQRLADEGITFEAAFTDAPWTLPAMSSVMTGRYPVYHRVRTWHDRLAPGVDTLAELLAGAGYDTAAIVGSFPLDRRFGLAQGFAYYDDEMSTSVMAEPTHQRVDETLFDRDVGKWMEARSDANAYRPDRVVVDRAIQWLDENEGAPFFLWVHLFGPHEKGKRPEGHAYPGWIEEQVAIYDDAVREMDAALGRLLARLREDPRFSETAVIFHADHGQSLMERGRFGHGIDVSEGALRVPLVVRLRGAKRSGERVPHLVRNLDIFPTLLSLAGLPMPMTDGTSLLEEHDDESHIYLETHHLVDFNARKVRMNRQMRSVGRIQEGIRTPDWKLIVARAAPSSRDDVDEPLPDAFMKARTHRRLFNVARDPLEQRDLSSQEPELVAALDALLERHRQTEPAPGAVRRALDDAERAQLRALGYAE